MTDLERVARAICEVDGSPYPKWEGFQDVWKLRARAAIMAIADSIPCKTPTGPYEDGWNDALAEVRRIAAPSSGSDP